MSDISLWQQADAILDALLDLPAQARADRLAAWTLTPALHQRVVQLLAAHEREDGVLDTALPDAGSHSSSDALSGRRLGPWVLEAEIGRGGMSVVYCARHAQHPGRQAALKLVTLGALAGAGGARFQREQAILSRLSHPHIVPLFDAGITADGTPWLAMALVTGERIDHWCDTHDCDVRKRVRLLLDVCDAVSYAHQNLVVHRDLKPSNVLVDGSGQVRLLDFGIARLLDEDLESTSTAYRALTPGYAAPEQFAGASAATTMDVYGLGALLHAVLTGRAPPLATGAADSALRAPASQALRDNALMPPRRREDMARALRGDLDAVLGMAMAPEPARRYGSVAALTADLHAWLEGRPVIAHAAGRGYRLRKFLTRHRHGVAATVALSLALATGVTTTLWQSTRAARAAQHAQAEAQRAGAIKDFLLALFTSVDPEKAGGAVDVRAVFARGSRRLVDDTTLPSEVRVELLATLGMVQRSMGWYDDATASYDDAVSIAAATPALDPGRYAETLVGRAVLRQQRTDLDGASTDLIAALRLAPPTDSASGRNVRIQALYRQAIIDAQLAQPARALLRLDEADALARGAADLPLQTVINLTSARGSTLYELGRYEEALVSLRAALALQRQPGNSGNASIALTLSWLAATSAALNRTVEALGYDEQALAIARASYPPDHPEIAGALYSIADSLRQLGRYEDALRRTDEAIAIQSMLPERRTALCLSGLLRARVLLALGRYGEVLDEVSRQRSVIDSTQGAASTGALLLVEQEVAAALELDAAPALQAALDRAADRLAAMAPELAWHPISQNLRWRIAESERRRGHRGAASAMLEQMRERQRDSGLTDTTTLRLDTLALRLAAGLDADAAGRFGAALESAAVELADASPEARGDAWLALAEAAARAHDAAAHRRALQTAATLHARTPLPLALTSALAREAGRGDALSAAQLSKPFANSTDGPITKSQTPRP
ncbi:MAG: serine/threonine protein kinase [Xanthomonadales bacterium]|nr:serine/threonine protein kinase [Xanthomonadales bacterium]